MINIKEDEKLNILNHSCAHLLAQAVQHLYPNAKFWVGPVIEEGFYYDIDLGDKTISDDDLLAIEKEIVRRLPVLFLINIRQVIVNLLKNLEESVEKIIYLWITIFRR